MRTTTTTMPRTTVEDLVHYLATGQDPHGRVAPGITTEMNFPHTVFTTTGKAELDRLRAGVSDSDWVMRVESTHPLPEGFAAVIEYDAHEGGRWSTYRTLTLVTVEGDHITHLAHWCTGAQA